LGHESEFIAVEQIFEEEVFESAGGGSIFLLL